MYILILQKAFYDVVGEKPGVVTIKQEFTDGHRGKEFLQESVYSVLFCVVIHD
ncbi:MAG: hypothetical protein AB7W16_15660 [Candidatus Obscuribacterales bacterium]